MFVFVFPSRETEYSKQKIAKTRCHISRPSSFFLIIFTFHETSLLVQLLSLSHNSLTLLADQIKSFYFLGNDCSVCLLALKSMGFGQGEKTE